MSIQVGGCSERDFPWENVALLNEETEETTLKLSAKNIYWSRNSPKVNSKIFALFLKKAPNITKLTIEQLKGTDALLLGPLIDLFKEHNPKHLVNLNIHTPDCNDHLKTKVGKLYKNLMNHLASPCLTQLTINDNTCGSFLNSEILSNFFTNSPNLQMINVSFKESIENLYIPFHLCQNLEQVSIEQYFIEQYFGAVEETFESLVEDTFQSLKNCKKLRTLILDLQQTKFMKFLIEHHNLNLRVLDFCNSPAISSDYELFKITKQLPNLEVFGQTLENQITDEGLALLGYNCPKLTSFSFRFKNITPSGFTKFIRKVNNLQKLKTRKAYHLNASSLIELAQNCPKLKSLELVDWKEITEPSLIALAQYCPQLEHIEISCCSSNVPLAGVEKFIQNALQLKMISVWSPSSKEAEPLAKKYPHLNWHPNFKDSDSIPLDPPTEIHKAEETPTFSQELLNQFLLESVRYEQLEDVFQYIKLGANSNAIQPEPLSNYSENSFVLAAQQGNLEIMRALVLNGADASVLFKGKYEFATIENIVKNPEVYTYLIEELKVPEIELRNLLHVQKQPSLTPPLFY